MSGRVSDLSIDLDEEITDTSQTGYPISGSGLEPRTSQIRRKNGYHTTAFACVSAEGSSAFSSRFTTCAKEIRTL
jgi:hypothetical protein